MAYAIPELPDVAAAADCGGDSVDSFGWDVAKRRGDSRRHRAHSLGRSAEDVGGAPHRRHFADAKRSVGPARGERPVRAPSQSAVHREHRAVGWIRYHRRSPLARADRVGAPRAGISRHRPMGGTSARVAPRRDVSLVRLSSYEVDPDSPSRRTRSALRVLRGGEFLVQRDVLHRSYVADSALRLATTTYGQVSS